MSIESCQNEAQISIIVLGLKTKSLTLHDPEFNILLETLLNKP